MLLFGNMQNILKLFLYLVAKDHSGSFSTCHWLAYTKTKIVKPNHAAIMRPPFRNLQNKDMMKHFLQVILIPAMILFFMVPCMSQGETLIVERAEDKQATVFYESHGEGFPVIILHRASAGYLEPIFSAREGFRRIYIDPPGIGNSGSEAWIQTADECFQIIDQAVRHILPQGQYAIGGFSYFGYMARAVAEANPLKTSGLLMMCPVVRPDYASRSLPDRIRTYTDSAFYKSLSREEQERIEGLVIKNAASYRAITQYRDTAVTMNRAFWDRIKRNNYAVSHLRNSTGVDAPVLLLLGLQDNVVGYKDALAIIERYPSISVVLADYASHALPYEQYSLLREHVNLWLDRIQINNQQEKARIAD